MSILLTAISIVIAGYNQKEMFWKVGNKILASFCTTVHQLIDQSWSWSTMYAQCNVFGGASTILSWLNTGRFLHVSRFNLALKGKWYRDTDDMIAKVTKQLKEVYKNILKTLWKLAKVYTYQRKLFWKKYNVKLLVKYTNAGNFLKLPHMQLNVVAQQDQLKK